MSKKTKKATRNAAYILFLIVFTLITLEVILRIYNPIPVRIKGENIILPANQTVYYRNKKITKLEPEIKISYNSIGFLGPEKPPDYDSSLSIFTVGGSTTACWGLPAEQSWPLLLSAELSKIFNNVWLNNAGIVGHSSYGHQLLLNEHVLQHKPKIIIFLTGINDVDRKDITVHDFSAPRSFKQRVLHQSELLNLAAAYLRSKKAVANGLGIDPVDFNQKRTDTLSQSEDSIRHALQLQQPLTRAYERRVSLLVQTCLRNNIKPVLITQPMLCGMGTDSTTGMNLQQVRIVRGMNGEMWNRKLQLYNEALKKVAMENNLLCIDLANLLPRNSVYYFDFVHQTRQGTQKITELIIPYIVQYISSEFPAYSK
jgi:hypothetical protein